MGHGHGISFAELLDRMITCIVVEEQAISVTFPLCVDKLEPHHKKSYGYTPTTKAA